MSYDLDVFDADTGESARRPLDIDAVRGLLAGLAGATVGDNEVAWELDGAAVVFTLVPDDDGVLRSVGATITDAVDASARWRDARRILDVLLDLADRLDARLFDPQLEAFVLDVDKSVAAFAGT